MEVHRINDKIISMEIDTVHTHNKNNKMEWRDEGDIHRPGYEEKRKRKENRFEKKDEYRAAITR